MSSSESDDELPTTQPIPVDEEDDVDVTFESLVSFVAHNNTTNCNTGCLSGARSSMCRHEVD